MNVIERFNRDIECVFERDPAATSKIEVILNYPGLHAIWMHRITHKLYKLHLRVLARFLSQVARFFTQVEIHPGAQLGEGLFIEALRWAVPAKKPANVIQLLATM